MSLFILEVGTEEMPARFLADLEKELAERFSAMLQKEGISGGFLKTMATPRRMVVKAEVAAVSEKREELVLGPPKRVAYDVGGRPTKAAEGFARTNGVELDAVFIETTEKGEYLAVKKQSGGTPALEILQRSCPEIIGALSFPKRMHWGSGTFTFGRPLRWILALLDSDIVPFTLGDTDSGNMTYGHRVYGPGPFTVASASAYDAVAADSCGVVVDPAIRRESIIQGGNALAEEVGGKVLWKESLLDEVQGLCEHPVPLLGSFDPDFLEIPREVLLTSMEGHQKSFGLEDPTGRLLPQFLTILNMTPPDVALVRRGWERVLRARLEDARFFWKTDLACSVDDWLAALDSVIFLAPLGSMGDKTRRLEKLCAWIASKTGRIPIDEAARAGRLSKADLVSGMVGEFDTLQGVMGGIYARKRGEKESVAAALSEQYLPTGPSSPVPATSGGAVLSIADKADTLVGCFGLGMIPTGAVDPYALRRCALGIARIIEEHGLCLDVAELFHEALRLYGEITWKLPPEEAMARLMEFFATRLKNQLISQGYPTLLVEAVLQADSRDVRSACARLSALGAFSEGESFIPAVQTFKRVANIVRKQEEEEEIILADAYCRELLAEDAEKTLATTFETMAPRFDALWSEGRYDALLGLLQEIRPVVDAFFNEVMVMADDPALKANRLGLLKSLASRFGRLADFTALQV